MPSLSRAGEGGSGAGDALPSSGKISPSDVRFSQDSISYRFRDGSSIDDLAEGLKSGRVNPNDVPPIRILRKDNLLFTLDNRRLEAFRRAGLEVPYRMATADEIASQSWKFTTKNQGISVIVRGGP